MVERAKSGNMTRERKRRVSSSDDHSSYNGEPLSKRGRIPSEQICSKHRPEERDSVSDGCHAKTRGKKRRRSNDRDRSNRRGEGTSQSSGSSRKRDSRRRSSHRKDRRRRSDSSGSVRSAKERKRTSKRFKDDKDGHLLYNRGDVLQARYLLLNKLGEGAFGQVVQCHDMDRNAKVALKIIKNVERYRDAAKLEVNVLKKITRKDPDGSKSVCVRMFDWFDFHGHICISFEVLGLSVFDYLKDNEYTPYNFEEVREISYQLCQAVAFLHDKLALTHTDLKPENVLLVNSDFDLVTSSSGSVRRKLKNRKIRLIDFGSATFDYEHHSRIVSTRHYRAPEVILELGWAQPCDVWSVGCIMFELYTGNTLFQTHDNTEHLRMMEKILGYLPDKMTCDSPKSYYQEGSVYLRRVNCRYEVHRYVNDHCKPLEEYRKSDSQHHKQLFNLIRKMLKYDPRSRVKMSRTLEAPLFDRLRESDCH